MPSYNSLYVMLISLAITFILLASYLGRLNNDVIDCNNELTEIKKELIEKDNTIVILKDSVEYYKNKHEEAENNCNHLNDYIANYLNLSSHSYIGAGNK